MEPGNESNNKIYVHTDVTPLLYVCVTSALKPTISFMIDLWLTNYHPYILCVQMDLGLPAFRACLHPCLKVHVLVGHICHLVPFMKIYITIVGI